jgi:hypothetical protein
MDGEHGDAHAGNYTPLAGRESGWYNSARATVAQSAEQAIRNGQVISSILIGGFAANG